MAYRNACDVHTHTIASRHAYSTITENVAAARAAGLELLGSADHLSAMIHPDPDIRNFQHFLNVSVWPRVWDGLVLLRGAEADIVSIEGDLFGQNMACPDSIIGKPYHDPMPFFDRVTGSLDYLVASVHNKSFTRDATLGQTTDMYIGVLEQEKVFILGHTGRAGVPYDLDEVLTVARDKHKLIEINEHSLGGGLRDRCYDSCRRIAERCAELGVGIAVSTDAHIAPALGRMPHAMAMLEEIHFPPELIMTRSAEAFLGQLAASGICDIVDCLE